MTALPRRTTRARLVAVTIALAIGGGACGLRTPVRPPEDTAPVIPGAATATFENGVTVVRWKRAERSADGERLDDLTAFVVERRHAGEERWQRVATIDVIDQEKIRRRQNYSWRDEAAPDGAEYRVFAVNADGQEGPPLAAEVVSDTTDPGEAADDSPAPTAP